MSANEKSPRKARGIAASGRLFHAVNGDGIEGDDLMTRVSQGGKRLYLNLGADPVQANYLNGIARKSLRSGKNIAEIRTSIEVALRAHRPPDAPPPASATSGPSPTRKGNGHSPAPSTTAPSSPHGGDLPKPTKADVSIEGSPSTPISPTPPKIAPPSHPPSTKAIQAGSWSSTNTIIHAGATTTAGYAHIFHLQGNERNSPPPSIKVPLFRELHAALTKFHTENFPRDSTLHGYWMSQLNAIETVSYARAGRLQDKPCRSGRKVSYEEFLFLSNGVSRPIMDCEISILDMLLADDFYNARMKRCTGRRTGGSKKRKRSAKISAKSELRQIRSLFKPSWAKVAYLRAGLKLPIEVHEFIGYSPGGPSRPPIRFSPTPDQVRDLFRFLHESVDKKDLHFAIVVVLALLAGLRHSEITHARKSWLKNTAWGYVLEVQSELDFTVKGERGRVVHLEPWLYDWLRSVSDREYLLSDVRAERNRTADRVLQKLRDLGFDTDKPLHCLRALYAAFLRATVKDEKDITEQMGHSDIRTTVTYYAPLPLARKLVPLWRQTLNSLGPRPQQMVLDFAA